ncbi:uncharacterized protein HaLaN_08439, partial [Haematococcus lacustris]
MHDRHQSQQMASGRLTSTLLAVLVVTVVALLATLLMPRLKLGSMDPVAAVDLMRMLGVGHYYSGVSFDAHYCAPSYSTVIKDITEADMTRIGDDLTKELVAAMSKLLGRWRDKMSAIFAKYMLSYNNTWALQCGRENHVPVLSTAGQDPCPLLSDSERVAQLGYHPVPQGPIQGIARDSIKYGVCMKSPEQRSSFGEWIIQERMHNPAWKTFNVPELDQDAVVLLFDLLYESLGVFKKQYWLGVITMQNPFDMMSINDIIYTIQPDLIIETGTAWLCAAGGPSTERQTLDKVKALVKPGQKVMVLLDSAHHAEHVLAELSEYCQFVTVNSYCIVQDTKLGRWSMDSRMLSTVKQWLSKGVGSKFAVDRDRELLYTHHAMGYLKRVKD